MHFFTYLLQAVSLPGHSRRSSWTCVVAGVASIVRFEMHYATQYRSPNRTLGIYDRSKMILAMVKQHHHASCRLVYLYFIIIIMIMNYGNYDCLYTCLIPVIILQLFSMMGRLHIVKNA